MADEVIIPGLQYGTGADGTIHGLPIGSKAISTREALEANQSWSTGIFWYKGNNSIQLAISADVPGTYLVQYFNEDGTLIPFMGNTVTFDPTLANAFQAGIAGKADGVKVTFTNGATPQSYFYCELGLLSQNVQETLRSMGLPMSGTNLGSTTHAAVEGRELSTGGGFKQATVSQVQSKVGLDVNVINRSNEVQEVSVNNLPSGGATETKQNTIINRLDESFDVNLPDYATNAAIVDALNEVLSVNVTNTDYAKDTSVISLSSVLSAIKDKLPTNPATDVTLNSIKNALQGDLKVNTVDVSALAKDASVNTFSNKFVVNSDGGVNMHVQNSDYAKDATTVISNALLVAIRDKLISGVAVTGSFYQATQPVSLATNTPDVTDRAGRLLGKVTVDGTVPVTGQFYPATQPVSIASNTPDVTDRAARLLGHVTVDNTVTVAGSVNANVTFPATQTVSGTVTANVTFPATQPVSLATNTPDITDRAARVLGHVVVDNLPATQAVSGTVTANVSFPATQAVSAATLPLPTGAATSANQATEIASIGAPTDAAVTNPATNASIIAAAKGLLTLIAAGNASLASILSSQIGFSTTSTQTTVAASTTGVQALAANANRKNAIITNTTSVAVNIYYGTATTARVASLTAIGQYWEMNPDLYKGVITVKSTSGTPLLEIVETS